MSQKIVINTCYGGYGLSRKAVMRYAELKGIELQPYISDFYKKIYGEYATLDNPEIYINYMTIPERKNFNPKDIERNDLDLIKVIEELGKEANDKFSLLEIIEIPDNVDWEITEYDGVETIHEKHRSWS